MSKYGTFDKTIHGKRVCMYTDGWPLRASINFDGYDPMGVRLDLEELKDLRYLLEGVIAFAEDVTRKQDYK